MNTVRRYKNNEGEKRAFEYFLSNKKAANGRQIMLL
jgi:hypothetical protein